MGSWGFSVFEDDLTADALGVFLRRPSLARLNKMLDDALSETLPSDLIASNALAAVELIAALRGQPSDQLPNEAMDWISANSSKLQTELVKKARRALKHVLDKSELLEIWEDSRSNWIDAMSALKKRISARRRRISSKALGRK